MKKIEMKVYRGKVKDSNGEVQSVIVMTDKPKTANEICGFIEKVKHDACNALYEAVCKKHPFIPFVIKDIDKDLRSFYSSIADAYIQAEIYENEELGIRYFALSYGGYRDGGFEVVVMDEHFDPRVKVGSYVLPQSETRKVQVVLEVELATNEYFSDQKVEERFREFFDNGITYGSNGMNLVEYNIISYEVVDRKFGAPYNSCSFRSKSWRDR